jgi:hypothetical protein
MKEKRFVRKLVEAMFIATAVEICKCAIQYGTVFLDKNRTERIENGGYRKGYNAAHYEIIRKLIMFRDIDVHGKDGTVHARMIID